MFANQIGLAKSFSVSVWLVEIKSAKFEIVGPKKMKPACFQPRVVLDAAPQTT